MLKTNALFSFCVNAIKGMPEISFKLKRIQVKVVRFPCDMALVNILREAA